MPTSIKASSLRPAIVRVMWENRERPLSTVEIYDLVSGTGVPDFDPKAQRDRNLVNRELSDLSGMSSNSHAKPAPELLTRVGRGRYVFRKPQLAADVALLREYLAPREVHEKRPPRPRRTPDDKEKVSDSVPMVLYAVQRGVCPGCGFYLPHYLRCEVDDIVALAGGRTPKKNLKLLCDFCKWVRDTKGKDGHRLKLADLWADNVATGVMVDEGLAVLTEKSLACYHRNELPT